MIGSKLVRRLKFDYFTSNFQTNYYEILGLRRTATQIQIKQKYYELAKKYHPDVNKQSDAKKQFEQIATAYKILSDVGRKSDYDSKTTYGEEEKANFRKSKKAYQKGGYEDEFSDPFTDYDSYFKKNKKYKKPKRGTDINVNINVTFKEAINGVSKTIQFFREELCISCNNDEFDSCYTCGGKGTIYNRSKRQKQDCTKCSSRGYLNNCSECRGKGTVIKTICEPIYVGKNTHNKTILRVEGHGNQGFKSRNGDLYATVLVEKSDKFIIDGNNVFSEHYVNYLTAIFGGKTTIQTVYGSKEIEIESGMQTGREIRLMNAGLQSAYSHQKGDHIITIRIKVPENLTSQQKHLFSKLI